MWPRSNLHSRPEISGDPYNSGSFLEVAQVIPGYQVQSALSGSFILGNFMRALSTA